MKTQQRPSQKVLKKKNPRKAADPRKHPRPGYDEKNPGQQYPQ